MSGGHVVEHLPLYQRTYRCPVCGLEIDRDENAARNLEKSCVEQLRKSDASI